MSFLRKLLDIGKLIVIHFPGLVVSLCLSYIIFEDLTNRLPLSWRFIAYLVPALLFPLNLFVYYRECYRPIVKALDAFITKRSEHLRGYRVISSTVRWAWTNESTMIVKTLIVDPVIPIDEIVDIKPPFYLNSETQITDMSIRPIGFNSFPGYCNLRETETGYECVLTLQSTWTPKSVFNPFERRTFRSVVFQYLMGKCFFPDQANECVVFEVTGRDSEELIIQVDLPHDREIATVNSPVGLAVNVIEKLGFNSVERNITLDRRTKISLGKTPHLITGKTTHSIIARIRRPASRTKNINPIYELKWQYAKKP